MTDGGEEGSDQGTLAVARRRFAESLPRKAAELRAGLALLAATPDGARPQKEMRRRVHALLASSQVFRLDALEEALRDAVHLLDTARSLGRALEQEELDQLANLCATLPALVHSTGAPPTDPPAPFPPTPTSRLASVQPVAPAAPVAPRGMEQAPPPPPAPGAAVEPPSAGRPRSHGTLRMGAVARPDAIAEGTPLRATSGSYTAVTRGTRPPPARAPAPSAPRAAPTVVSVLVVDGVESQSSVRAMLAVDAFEVTGASDPEEALRLARSTAPDVVLADRAIVHRPGVDLVGRLRSDPLTDFVPIVLLLPPGAPNDPVAVREVGADDAIERPIDPEQLRATIGRVVAMSQGAPAAPDALPDLTLSDLADRVADEVRRGIVAAADRGGELIVPLGGGGEVLAATWAAVARIRSFVARRTGGRVRFRDPPGRGPALLALVAGGDDALPDPTAGEVSLDGRRALVVDDDPSIVWFFSGLLRSAGMTVFECFNGNDALVIARRERPELVVTDILMPGLDGFGLLRELRRDLLLADVPVIVLSWKEDFLQRMRELGAPADAYLRKEVGAAETLLRVKEVLRPRARVEAALRRENDVRGRLERLGFAALVEVVARQWSDARIVVRDAAHLFELDVRDGAPVDVTRTAVDGTFARGPSAFLNLVGLRSGRFTVQRATSTVRATLQGTLDEQLRDATARIGACIDAVSGSALVKASRVRIDDAAADALERTSPEPMRSLLARLRDGESPRDLVTSGEIAAPVLETCLVDLARRGAILAVRGLDGEDRLAEMLDARSNPGRSASVRPPRADSEPPQPIRLSDPELRAVVLSDHAERMSSPPPMPADAVRTSIPHTYARESSQPSPRESTHSPARITDPPILRLSDPDLLRADDTPRTPGQRRTLELVGDDSALAAAVAALVAPPPDGPAPSRPPRAHSSMPAPRAPVGAGTSAAASEPSPSRPPSSVPATEAPRNAPPSEPPIDPFELDEAFRPAVIPVPILPLSTATARASKSEPPQHHSEPPVIGASTDSVPSLDDSDEIAALVADLRTSLEPSRVSAPAESQRTSAPAESQRVSAPPESQRTSAPPETRTAPPPLRTSAPPAERTSAPPVERTSAPPMATPAPAAAPASTPPVAVSKPPRADPSEPDIEITVPEAPPPRRSESSRPSDRPVVDGALPSVIVSNDLDPIVTNISASKAARMGLVPGSQPSSSGGLFVLVLILVGLVLIGALGWSMAKRRTAEPTSGPERQGVLQDVRPAAIDPPATGIDSLALGTQPSPSAAASAVAVAVRPAAPSALAAPARALPSSDADPGLASGRLRLLLPTGPARRPLPYEVFVDGRRVHRSDIVTNRDLVLERDVPVGVREVRVRRAGNLGYRAVYVQPGHVTEVDLRL